jgi:7,8-dihydropterin-6-yl-methyl-4-(beta-D-ribofuranosyl)aminobenzene 5'-phosphate synthase
MKITCLLENSVQSKGLVSEHGLSFHVGCDDGGILFDCGQTGLFLQNAAALGINLMDTGKLVFSHGHYDHTGGMGELAEKYPDMELCAHPGIFIERYIAGNTQDSKPRSVGFPYERKFIENNFSLKLSKNPVEISQSVYFTGQIPRANDFEDTGGRFYLDKDMKNIDIIEDDCSLVVKTGKGIIVLLGCCHSGIINALEYISSVWNTDSFALVAGGTHLHNAPDTRMNKTISCLKKFNIARFCPGHCSGWKALCVLHNNFPDKISPIYTGWTWTDE